MGQTLSHVIIRYPTFLAQDHLVLSQILDGFLCTEETNKKHECSNAGLMPSFLIVKVSERLYHDNVSSELAFQHWSLVDLVWPYPTC